MTPAVPMTVVVPCHNEEEALAALAGRLDALRRDLAGRYEMRVIIVDDGSTDATWAVMRTLFGSRPDCRLLRHATNRGIAAAILTGIAAADTEAVCTLDCDGSYDPRLLARMLPRLVDGVDLVTASPYHRDGGVDGVPGWRLFLSKGLSRLYRLVLTNKLATYTSACRVHRRSAMMGLDVRDPGFVGVAEMLCALDRRGGGIVEVPATLGVRTAGRSKLRVVRTIARHLHLLARLLTRRLLPSPSEAAGLGKGPQRV